MVVFLVISLALIFLALIGAVLNLNTTRNGIKELKDKTDFALQEDVMMKIEMKDRGLLSHIADNFNKLIRMVQNLDSTRSELEKETGKIKEMDHKLKDFEDSISQTNMLVDLGMEITSSLDVDEIIKKVHEFISSSMEMEEIELMHVVDGKKVFKIIDRKGHLTAQESVDQDDRENVLNWAMENRKEVILNDAQKDYGQYVFKPITGLSGSKPNSLICIPLVLHDRVVGAIAVGSLKKDAYNQYHVDFIRGIGSYISVAFDNANVYKLLDASKQEIESEKQKSDDLLLNILPSEVADELKAQGYAEAKRFEQVSVLFSDFRNFTGISELLSPEELVSELNIYFKAFDGIVEKYNLEKIKTIGDAYMLAGGMSGDQEESVRDTVMAGLEMQDFVTRQSKATSNSDRPSFSMRVGIHTGPVVAGIVGAKKFQYDIWGDTVNTASRMESSSMENKVNISEATYNLIKDDPSFQFENRGEVEAKHKGEITMFFVEKK